MAISKQNINFLRGLRDRGILEEMAAEKMELGNGIITIPCCDGDQMHDLYTNLAALFKGVRQGDPRIHPLPRHGGAMCLSPSWPGSKIKTEGLREEVAEAYLVKKIPTVVPFVHFPCAMKRTYGLAAPQVIDMLLDAKLEIKRIGSEVLDAQLRVIPCVHVDWGDGRKRTYKIKRTAWMAVREEFLESEEAAA